MMLKAITRGAVNAAMFLFLLPFVIMAAMIWLPLAAWDRLELWAFYDNDVLEREKDRWRHS